MSKYVKFTALILFLHIDSVNTVYVWTHILGAMLRNTKYFID